MMAVQTEDSDQRALVDDSDSEDSDYDQSLSSTRIQWWFLEPAVKRNWCVVMGAYILLSLGFVLVLIGIILEIVFHSKDVVVRGVIFIAIGVLLLIPSVYAVVHVYVAAKKIGRIRLSSVWFFR